MITDLDKYTKLLDEFGVGYQKTLMRDGKLWLVRSEVSDEKVDGYSSFYFSFNFDVDGKFQEVEVAE